MRKSFSSAHSGPFHNGSKEGQKMNIYKIIIVVTLMVVAMASVPAVAQVSLPLVETDTTVPAAAGLVFTINAVNMRGGGGLTLQNRADYERLSRLSDREFELRRLMSKDVLASYSSTFGSLAKVVGEKPYDYWISVTKVAPAEIEDFAISFQSDAGRKDYRIGDEKEDRRDLSKPVGYSLTLMGDSGYCLAMPKLESGIYTPVAWVKVKGSKTYRLLGLIPVNTKMSNSFTGGFQFQVIRSPRDLSSCSAQQLTDILTDPRLGLGWSSATLDPEILDEVLNKRPLDSIEGLENRVEMPESQPEREEVKVENTLPVVETRPEVVREGYLTVRFSGKEPMLEGWPEVKILGPDGEHFIRVPAGGKGEHSSKVPVGEYRLAGVSQSGWVLDSDFSKRLGAGDEIVFQIRPKEGR